MQVIEPFLLGKSPRGGRGLLQINSVRAETLIYD
jgi:hypothetical protein